MGLHESESDTIAAISTPPGEGGIGMVRISGPDALRIADGLFESKKKTPPSRQKSFTVQYGRVLSKGKTIDEALLLVMRGPKSYTCEDVVEISVHGGRAPLEAVLTEALSGGARLAARGEFTKRAFLNGRLDLLQAEAVLDLVSAKTRTSLQWASAQLEGALSRKLREIKKNLIDILSHIEASIDFPDDFPDVESTAATVRRLKEAAEALSGLLKTASLSFLAKKGLRVVLVGRPNVGKSSLMNCLAQVDRVIVTPFPGTTRDVVEEEIALGGFPVRLQDTAGFQETEHPIEKEGIERSKAAVQGADLILYVLDGSEGLTSEDKTLLNYLDPGKVILVINKADLKQGSDASEFRSFPTMDQVHTSCVGMPGVQALEKSIVRMITGGQASISEEPVVTSVRQKDALEKAVGSVQEACSTAENGQSPELIAVDVRQALDQIGFLTGEVVNDEILDAVFSQFCIGK